MQLRVFVYSQAWTFRLSTVWQLVRSGRGPCPATTPSRPCRAGPNLGGCSRGFVFAVAGAVAWSRYWGWQVLVLLRWGLQELAQQQALGLDLVTPKVKSSGWGGQAPPGPSIRGRLVALGKVGRWSET